jgi:hypothetical protein
MDINDCDLRYHCKNAGKRCLFCDGKSQYVEIKYKNHNNIEKYNTPSKKKKGMDLEETVRIKYNEYMAQRMPLSGGISGFEGDIKTALTLMECKEKTIKIGGKKQITIKKEWHNRIENEAKKHEKIPFLIYGFKIEGQKTSDINDIYFSTKYSYLLEMLYQMKNMKEKIEILKKELEKEKNKCQFTQKNSGDV